MPNNKFLPEIKNAVAAGDMGKVENLDALSRLDPENERDAEEFDFVPVSAQFAKYGADSCLVINESILEIPVSRRTDFTEYLERSCRREFATYEDEESGKEFAVVMFPGRPEEVYSLTAISNSLRTMWRQNDNKKYRQEQKTREAEMSKIEQLKTEGAE